jgi:syntaxin 16
MNASLGRCLMYLIISSHICVFYSLIPFSDCVLLTTSLELMSMYPSLAKKLQELSVQFRQSQRKYLAEVQAQKSGRLGPDSKFGIDLDEGGGLGNRGGSYFTTQQLAVVDDLTLAVQSRDQEIVKIAQSIEELGTIFKELAVLVIDQGTILDRIDYNMESVVENTKTGIKQLEKAEKHQKNARPVRCIIGLSITIFVLMAILILKHRPRHGWF